MFLVTRCVYGLTPCLGLVPAHQSMQAELPPCLGFVPARQLMRAKSPCLEFASVSNDASQITLFICELARQLMQAKFCDWSLTFQ